MKYLFKVYKENQSMKNFKNQVFDLNKKYDEINNNLGKCVSGFMKVCKQTNE